ncbi:MAG: hypothetical protein M9913_23435 [Bryobacteraceae bacterium]|nr:hypothetical protein [Solibacteraceae bacterium]MCO5353792.1 hypothetical protein [Bryobacteraceae bacterium]
MNQDIETNPGAILGPWLVGGDGTDHIGADWQSADGDQASIDLHVEVPAVPFQELRTKAAGASSAQMRERVLAARELQSARGFINAEIPSSQIRRICPLDDSGERTLELAVRRMGFSARAHDRILKVARTIADLAKSENIAAKHVAEAVQYRSLDRSYWG